MAKLPYMQFYPGDWLKATDLRGCSPTARGVWIDLLCLMWESPSRGTLPYTDSQIADTVAGPYEVVLAAVVELVSAGVASRDDGGALYSRRMVRDYGISQARAIAGHAGGEETQTRKSSKRGSKTQAKLQQTIDKAVKQTAKQNSSKTLIYEYEYLVLEILSEEFSCSNQFMAAWADWVEHRRNAKKPLTERTAKTQLNWLKEMGCAKSIKAIDEGIARAWRVIKPEWIDNAYRKNNQQSSPARIRGHAPSDDRLNIKKPTT